MAYEGYDRSITMPFELAKLGEKGTVFKSGYVPEVKNGKHTGKWIYRIPEEEEFIDKEGYKAKPINWVKTYPVQGYNAQGDAVGDQHTGVFKDSLNNYIYVEGNKETMENIARDWVYNIHRRKKLNYPTPSINSEAPSQDNNNDMHGAFIPEMGYKWSASTDTLEDFPLGAGGMREKVKFKHEYDVRGFETTTGKTISYKGGLVDALASRYIGDTVGLGLDTINLGLTYGPRMLDLFVNPFMQSTEYLGKKGVGIAGEIFGVREWQEIGDRPYDPEKAAIFDPEGKYGTYDATKLTELTKGWGLQAGSWLPGRAEIINRGLPQPTLEEHEQGVAYYSGEDIESFITNPEASWTYKVMKEIGIGWYFMKATNWALRTIPKGKAALAFYSMKGKHLAWEKHVRSIHRERRRVKNMSSKDQKAYYEKYGPDGKYGTYDVQAWQKYRQDMKNPEYEGKDLTFNPQFVKMWKESSKYQKDEMATYALQRNISNYGKEHSWFTTKYFAITQGMRLDIGKKLTYAGPTIFAPKLWGLGQRTVKVPKGSYGPPHLERKTLQPYQNFFSSEEWAGNVTSSTGAVTLGTAFKDWFGDDDGHLAETAGYIIGGLSFAITGTVMWNKGFPLAATGVSQFVGATGGPLDLKGVLDHLRGRESITSWLKRNPDGSTSPLTRFEQRQIEHLRVWISKMDPDRRENVLNRIGHYDSMLKKLVSMGGDHEILAQKLGDIADITSLRILAGHMSEDLDLGTGIHLNIHKIEGTFERKRKELLEISQLIKNTMTPETKSQLAEGELGIMQALNHLFNKDIEQIEYTKSVLDSTKELTDLLLRPSLYRMSGDITQDVQEAWNKMHVAVRTNLKNIIIGDPNLDLTDPKTVEKIVDKMSAPYRMLETKEKKYVEELIQTYRDGEIDSKQVALDFVKLYETIQLKRMDVASEVFNPLWVKLSREGNLDISDWAKTYMVSGTDILADSTLPANILAGEVIVDSSLIEDVLGGFIRGKMKSRFSNMAAADTSGRSPRELIDFYQKRYQKNYKETLDITDGLSIYRWLSDKNVTKAQKDEFRLVFGENIADLKVDVKDLSKIYTSIATHISRLTNVQKNNPSAFVLNSIKTLTTFRNQLDELFSAKYGKNHPNSLAEWKDAREIYAADIAPFYNSKFKKDYANYDRTLVNWDDEFVHESGSNHLYGYDVRGKPVDEWLPTIIELIHTKPTVAARLLNVAFGERVTIDGVPAFRILDENTRIALGEIIKKGVNQYNYREMDDFLMEINWDMEKANLRGTANITTNIRKRLRNEHIFDMELVIPRGTQKVTGGNNVAVGEPVMDDIKVFAAGDGTQRMAQLRRIAQTNPKLKAAMEEWDYKMKLTQSDLGIIVQKEVATLDFQKGIIDEFLNSIDFRRVSDKDLAEGVANPSMNLEKLYDHLITSGSTKELEQYKNYFIRALRNTQPPITHEVTIANMWQSHIRKIMSHGFDRKQMEPIKFHGKPLTETKLTAENKFQQEVQRVFKDDTLDHLQQNANVYKEAWGKDIYDDMVDVTDFLMYGDVLDPATGVATKIRNMPSSMQLNAIMSRLYAIQRDVVSPRWVITEMLLHSIRKKRIGLLGLLIQNPELIGFVSQAIKVGEQGGIKMYGRKPIMVNEDMHTRFNSMLLKTINQAWAETTAIDSVFPFTFEYFKLDEHGSFEAPKEGSIINVPIQRGYREGGIINQMNNLSF